MQLDSTNYAIAKIKSSKEDLDTDLHRHPFYELFFFYGKQFFIFSSFFDKWITLIISLGLFTINLYLINLF